MDIIDCDVVPMTACLYSILETISQFDHKVKHNGKKSTDSLKSERKKCNLLGGKMSNLLPLKPKQYLRTIHKQNMAVIEYMACKQADQESYQCSAKDTMT